MTGHTFLCIDLKSFYASVECVERGKNPLTTNLVVADESRTGKTICLAVSPSLKDYGISGRARLFQVIQRTREINRERRKATPGQRFAGKSFDDTELKIHPELELDYIVAPPRMALYIDYSVRVYQVYLKYLAPEDIHPYSIDEIFAEVTDYLNTYKMSAVELAEVILQDIYETTGITATAGIGTNMYLSKVAMDIVAKHLKPGKNGVRIAKLDERTYRRLLWAHRPLTDFWRIGNGYAKRLEEQGLFTMGDVARCSIGKPDEYYNEDLLYKLFGVNAQLLIDHAWGWEPCTMEEVKSYRPQSNSMGSGQVLQCPYDFEKAKLVVREMAELLVLDLVDKRLVTDQMVLHVGYDVENLADPKRRKAYTGEIKADHYGRLVPKHAHGTVNLGRKVSSTKLITDAVLGLYERIVDKKLLIRRVSITANHVVAEAAAEEETSYEQMDLFTDYEALQQERAKEEAELQKEKRLQRAMLDIKKRYGKNAILKGTNLVEGATTMQRNQQIGGHRA